MRATKERLSSVSDGYTQREKGRSSQREGGNLKKPGEQRHSRLNRSRNEELRKERWYFDLSRRGGNKSSPTANTDMNPFSSCPVQGYRGGGPEKKNLISRRLKIRWLPSIFHEEYGTNQRIIFPTKQ